ncbi:MAG TPA: hypothetical protein VH599_17185 [Ktedonobacterales bacterium]|jgi:hypothetical protein
MVLLKAPIRINQLTAGGQYPHEDCGESCASSILTDFGRPHSVRDIEDFAKKYGDAPKGGTGAEVYHALFHQYGVPSILRRGLQADWLLPALDNKHECMVAIWSNHAGDPTPGSTLGHWVIVYGYDDAKYYFMNPVNEQLQTCSIQQLRDAAQNLGLEITTVLPKDQEGGSHGMLVHHPLNNARLDVFYLSPDGNIWHTYSERGGSGLAHDAEHNKQNLGHPGQEPLAPLQTDAAYDNTGNYIDILAVGISGQVYLLTIHPDNKVVTPWVALSGVQIKLPAPPVG